MEKIVIIDENKYEIIKEYKNGFVKKNLLINVLIIFMTLIMLLETGHMINLD